MEKGCWLGAEGQVGRRQEELSEEETLSRSTVEQKGWSHTLRMSVAFFVCSPVGQPCSWKRMDNTEAWTWLRSVFLWQSELVLAKLSSHWCSTVWLIYFPVTNPPPFACAFLSVQLNKPPISTPLCKPINYAFCSIFSGSSPTLKVTSIFTVCQSLVGA